VRDKFFFAITITALPLKLFAMNHLRLLNSAVVKTLERLEWELKNGHNQSAGVVKVTEENCRLLGSVTKLHRVFVSSHDTGKYVNMGWVLQPEMYHCMICLDPFGPTDTKDNCRACGIVLCRRCVDPFPVIVDALEACGPLPVGRCCYWGQEHVEHIECSPSLKVICKPFTDATPVATPPPPPAVATTAAAIQATKTTKTSAKDQNPKSNKSDTGSIVSTHTEDLLPPANRRDFSGVWHRTRTANLEAVIAATGMGLLFRKIAASLSMCHTITMNEDLTAVSFHEKGGPLDLEYTLTIGNNETVNLVNKGTSLDQKVFWEDGALVSHRICKASHYNMITRRMLLGSSGSSSSSGSGNSTRNDNNRSNPLQPGESVLEYTLTCVDLRTGKEVTGQSWFTYAEPSPKPRPIADLSKLPKEDRMRLLRKHQHEQKLQKLQKEQEQQRQLQEQQRLLEHQQQLQQSRQRSGSNASFSTTGTGTGTGRGRRPQSANSSSREHGLPRALPSHRTSISSITTTDHQPQPLALMPAAGSVSPQHQPLPTEESQAAAAAFVKRLRDEYGAVSMEEAPSGREGQRMLRQAQRVSGGAQEAPISRDTALVLKQAAKTDTSALFGWEVSKQNYNAHSATQGLVPSKAVSIASLFFFCR
jgi:hypothetical protein